jgi:hypothetical protein
VRGADASSARLTAREDFDAQLSRGWPSLLTVGILSGPGDRPIRRHDQAGGGILPSGLGEDIDRDSPRSRRDRQVPERRGGGLRRLPATDHCIENQPPAAWACTS